MSTPIPNPYGRALEQATQNFLDIYFGKRRLALEEARIGLEGERVGLERERVGLEAERVEQSERAFVETQRMNALQRALQLMPFAKPGSPVNPALLNELSVALPEADPANLASLLEVLETPESVLRGPLVEQAQRTADYLRTLPPDEQAKLTERLGHRATIGQPVTTTGLRVQETIEEAQARGLTDLLRDPENVRNIARTLVGFDKPLTLQFPDPKAPGGLRRITFDSPDAARISFAIWQHLDTMALRREEMTLSRKGKEDVAKELMDLAKEKDIGITRAHANLIIDAVHATDADGKSIGEQRVNTLRESLMASGSTNVLAALDLYLYGAKLALQLPEEITQQFPGLDLYMTIGSALEERFGKEETAAIMPHIVSKLRERGTNVAGPRGGLRGWIDRELTGSSLTLGQEAPSPEAAAVEQANQRAPLVQQEMFQMQAAAMEGDVQRWANLEPDPTTGQPYSYEAMVAKWANLMGDNALGRQAADAIMRDVQAEWLRRMPPIR